MTMHAAIYGAAFRDAEVRESKAGSKYASVLAIVPNGTDEARNDTTIMIRIMAFHDNIERLSQVKAQDKLYAEGRMSCKVYEPQASACLHGQREGEGSRPRPVQDSRGHAR
jgi:hypothetical protein